MRCNLINNIKITIWNLNSLHNPTAHDIHSMRRWVVSGFVRYLCFFASNKAFSSSVNFWCSSFICSTVGSRTFSTGIGVPTKTKKYYIFDFGASPLLQSRQLVCRDY
jgi:hypothetical protein